MPRSIFHTLRSHCVKLGTAVHAERLRMLEKLNQARVQNQRIQAILEFRENHYQDIMSKFAPVLEEVDEFKRRLFDVVAPPELTQRVQDIEA